MRVMFVVAVYTKVWIYKIADRKSVQEVKKQMCKMGRSMRRAEHAILNDKRTAGADVLNGGYQILLRSEVDHSGHNRGHLLGIEL